MSYDAPASDSVRRIYIYGCSGSGKSTLARRLSTRLRIPHLELDDLMYETKHTHKRSHEAARTLLHEFLQKNDAWVLEGTYLRWTQEAMAAADVFIDLHEKRHVMVYRMLKRGVMRKLAGSTEESVRGWCELTKYIWKEYPANYEERKSRMQAIVTGNWIELKSKRDIDRFISSLPDA
jgi:adenylate kinase family enzyme